MKTLLMLSAAVEAPTGLGLLVAPTPLLLLLLGAATDAPVGCILARVAGAALLALGVACAFARRDVRSPAAAGVVAALLFYNTVAAALLVIARCGSGLTGAALWPAVVVHAGLGAWCAACLNSVRAAKALTNAP